MSLTFKPMSEAPKDGRQVLVRFRNREGEPRYACVRWRDGRWLAGRAGDHLVEVVEACMLAWADLPPHDFKPVERPELIELARSALNRFMELPASEQQRNRAAQWKSWVVGEYMLAHPECSREEAEQVYEEVSR